MCYWGEEQGKRKITERLMYSAGKGRGRGWGWGWGLGDHNGPSLGSFYTSKTHENVKVVLTILNMFDELLLSK